MAYMSQEKKAALTPSIKAICKKYGVKATIAVDHHSTLVLNVKSSKIDFIGSYNRVVSEKHPDRFNPAGDDLSINPYWYNSHFDGKALAFLQEVIPAMNVGNHNRSDIQSDYWDVGFYIEVNIGKWNKPYILEK